MGVIVGTIDWMSSLNAAKDATDLCTVIKNTLATRYDGWTVFF